MESWEGGRQEGLREVDFDQSSQEQLVRHSQAESVLGSRLSQHEAASVASSVPSSKSSRRDSAISSSSRTRPKRTSSRSISRQPAGTLVRSPSSIGSGTSRPRARRVISSPHVQSNGPNIEQALALHERSCRIFESSFRPATSCGSKTTALERPSLPRSVTASDMPVKQDCPRPAGPIRAQTTSDGDQQQKAVEDSPQYDNFVPATILHWTSTETRRKEYESIDRSNRGIRGLFKKMFPMFATKASTSKFYDEKEGSDTGSVRRFRLDLPDEEEVDGKR